jgi:hypothetical protein
MHMDCQRNPNESNESAVCCSGLGVQVARYPGTIAMFQTVGAALGACDPTSKGPVEILVIDHVERPSEN